MQTKASHETTLDLGCFFLQDIFEIKHGPHLFGALITHSGSLDANALLILHILQHPPTGQ